MKTEKRKHKRRKRRSLMERGRRFLRTRREPEVLLKLHFQEKFRFLNLCLKFSEGLIINFTYK